MPNQESSNAGEQIASQLRPLFTGMLSHADDEQKALFYSSFVQAIFTGIVDDIGAVKADWIAARIPYALT